MKNLRLLLIITFLGVTKALPTALAQDYGGLPPGEGRVEVFAWCSACHSTRIIIQQGLTKEDWDDLLVWMTEEQGMQEIETTMREKILNYLSEQFPPERPHYKSGIGIQNN